MPLFVLAMGVSVACFMLWISHNRAAEKVDTLNKEVRMLRESLDRIGAKVGK